MTFTEALTAVFKDTDRITRTSWRNRDLHLRLDGSGKLCATWNSDENNRIDGVLHPYLIDESDFFAADWEVVTDA